MSHGDFLSFEEFNRRSATPHTHTTPAAVGIAVVAGVYTLCRFLDFLGYPVGSWLRRLAHTMALEMVRAVSPAPSLDSTASDDSAASGGLMGNLFGMGASALSKGVRGVASALSRGPSDVPPGLGNLDNSCYQNSVIQGLAALPSLRAYLEHTHADAAPPPDTTAAALLHMIAQLNDPAQRGQHFWVRGKLKSMSTFTQQDAQEYYSRILDELDKDAAKPHAPPDAPPDHPKPAPVPLEGSLAQRVGCTTCGYSEGLSLIPFNCITVSLGRRTAYDIRQLLDDHTDLEYIDGVECSKCTLLKLKRTLVPVVEKQGHDTPFGARLRLVQDALDDQDLKDSTLIKTLNIPKKNWVKSEKSKQVVVARAPKSLVLHVNRSIFDETTFAQYKNNAGVSYPSTLDLGRWCLGAAPSGTQKPDLDPKTDEWPRDPKKSMLADARDHVPSPFQYRLRAAVTHFGTHGNGHYVCYRPHPRVVRKNDAEGEGEEVEVEEKEDGIAHDEDVSEAADAQVEVEQKKEEQQEEEPEEEQEEEQQEAVQEDEEQDQPPTEQWYRFSDDTVYAVSEQEAHQGNVFMLFYERIDDPTPPLPEAETAALALSTVSIPDSPSQTALDIPLPADDVETQTPPETTVHATPPPPITSDEPDASETDPDPDSDADAHPSPAPTLPKLSPHTMRTAGNASSRNSGGRASLPLVSAS